MPTLTMRCIKGDFVVSGPDIEARKFKSRPEARDWCKTHHPGSPITEIGRGGSTVSNSTDPILSPDDPLAQPPLLCQKRWQGGTSFRQSLLGRPVRNCASGSWAAQVLRRVSECSPSVGRDGVVGAVLGNQLQQVRHRCVSSHS